MKHSQVFFNFFVLTSLGQLPLATHTLQDSWKEAMTSHVSNMTKPFEKITHHFMNIFKSFEAFEFWIQI